MCREGVDRLAQLLHAGGGGRSCRSTLLASGERRNVLDVLLLTGGQLRARLAECLPQAWCRGREGAE